VNEPTAPATPTRTASERPDLRLALPAVSTWLVMLAAAPLPAEWVVAGAAALLTAALLLLCGRRGAAALLAAATLLCCGGGLAATGLRGVARTTGPLPGLAAAGAQATLEVVVTADPRAVAVRAQPGHPGRSGAQGRLPGTAGPGAGPGRNPPPTLWVVPARAERVRAGPRAWRVRQPVLVLATGQGWSSLLPSQRLRLPGSLQAPRPGDTVAAVIRVRGPPDVLSGPSRVQAVAGGLRAGLRAAAAGLAPAERGLLPGLVDGDTGGLDPQLADDFRRTGLTHLVAVSGSNCVAVLAAALLLGRLLRLGPRLSPVVAGALLVGFVVLARPSPSVVRAATMGLLGLGAVVAGRTRPALPALAATVLGSLLLSPELARAPGFALSVLASGALLVLVPGWRAALVARGWRRRAAEAVTVPLAAQLACGPVIAVLSSSVSVVAVPANLLAMPAVPLATVAGVVAAVLAPLSPTLARLAAQLASVPCWWLVTVARVGAAAPGAQVSWAGGVGGGLILAGTTVAVLACLRRRRGRRLLVGAAAVVLVTVVLG